MEQIRNIKLILAYDGTNYFGWQIQNSERTVEEEVVKALLKIHGDKIPYVVAGRTDRGVHANGQVLNFKSHIASIPTEKFKEALNSLLPRDIRVIRSEQVEEDFHARYSARARVYQYYISHFLKGSFNSRYAWYQYPPFDINKLNRMASVLVGEHDFSTFAKFNPEVSSYIRRIYSASFFYEGDYLVFRIVGNAFLWNMVRSIVGTLIAYARNPKEDKESIESILRARDRKLAGFTAPAHALYLERVIYSSLEWI